MNPNPELEQNREPMGAQDSRPAVSDDAGAPEEARTVPDPDNRTKAAFVHRRTSPLPPEQAAGERRQSLLPGVETIDAVEMEPRPSVWEATGLDQRAYADKDAPESDQD
jgi:hypothetical protein